MKCTIRGHLAEGQLTEAFSAALSANSLALVEATCDMVNPARVFSQERGGMSILPQTVLLALVQQLSEFLHCLFQKNSFTMKPSL